MINFFTKTKYLSAIFLISFSFLLISRASANCEYDPVYFFCLDNNINDTFATSFADYSDSYNLDSYNNSPRMTDQELWATEPVAPWGVTSNPDCVTNPDCFKTTAPTTPTPTSPTEPSLPPCLCVTTPCKCGQSSPTTGIGYGRTICPDGTWVDNPINCPSATTPSVPGVTNVPGNVVINNNSTTNNNIVGGYGLVSTSWSGNYGWATYPTTYYNWPVYGSSQSNNVVNTVLKYQCPDGSIVADVNKCPAMTCNNGAMDWPTCTISKRCVTGVIDAADYPTCGKCADTAEIYYNGDTRRCVAKCDIYSERDPSNGSCRLKPCTNGALTPPYCRDCPANMPDIWNGKCMPACPNNQYRTDAGCVAYQCQNGATDYPNCGTCPSGKFLQSDGVCKACDTGTSWNGYGCVKNACTNDAINYPECSLCVTGMEYVTALKTCKYPCSNGYTRNNSNGACDLINTQCNNYAVNYPTCTQCPTGYDYIGNGCVAQCASGYVRTASGGCTVQTVTCPNGATIPITQSCPPEMRACDGGVYVSYYASCPVSTYNPPIIINQPPIVSNYTPNAGGTQVISNNNIQLKQCPDGQTVAINSVCPYTNNTSNSVNTTHFSNLNSNSLVCNGLANIYANMPSYGWFEWGTDESRLTNRTPTQFIGKNTGVTYSAPLKSLTPNTIYYCRAVMANNMGTYKGEIIREITLGNAVNYAVAKVEKVTTTKSSVKQIKTTTPSYVCKDDYGNKAVIQGGEKLLTLSIDKSVTIYQKGDKVSYAVNYKNTSKVAVKNIELKINIPKELSEVKATKGDIKDNDIIYKLDELGPKGEGVILVDALVGDVELGRNLTVAALMTYDMPTKDKLRDEVSAINVGSVKSTDVTPKTSDGKAKVVASGNSFLPNTLIGWAIIILIIFIVVVGWRAWKAKREESHH